MTLSRSSQSSRLQPVVHPSCSLQPPLLSPSWPAGSWAGLCFCCRRRQAVAWCPFGSGAGQAGAADLGDAPRRPQPRRCLAHGRFCDEPAEPRGPGSIRLGQRAGPLPAWAWRAVVASDPAERTVVALGGPEGVWGRPEETCRAVIGRVMASPKMSSLIPKPLNMPCYVAEGWRLPMDSGSLIS